MKAEFDLQIMEMDAAHVAQVAALEAELFSVPWSAQAFADTLAMEQVLFYMALVDNCVAGYCGVYLAADEGEITNVAVAPAYRRHKVAESLLRNLLTDAFRKGARRVFLEVRRSNDPAVQLYQKIGFQITGIRKNFYQFPAEDAFVMMYEYLNAVD